MNSPDAASTPDATTPPEDESPSYPFDPEPGRELAACIRAEHALHPRPPAPPGRRVPLACAPGFTVERTQWGSVLRNGTKEVGHYLVTGSRHLDLDGDGSLETKADSPVPSNAAPLRFRGCSDEEAEAITTAYYEALGGGTSCLSDGNPSLAGDFLHVIGSAVITFECTALPPGRCADVSSDVQTPADVCNAGTTPYRVRLDLSRFRSRACGSEGFPKNLPGAIFHEILHTFVPTLSTHSGDPPEADQVKACQAWSSQLCGNNDSGPSDRPRSACASTSLSIDALGDSGSGAFVDMGPNGYPYSCTKVW